MNPWTASFEEHRQNILGEAKKKSDKKSSERWQDDDCDDKWYEKSDVDGKISDREKKEKKKHYAKEDIADIIARLEKKRISKGGDPKESPLPSMRKYHADKKKKKKKVKEEVVQEADSLSAQVARWEANRQRRMKRSGTYERPNWIPRDQDHEDRYGSSKGEKKKPQKKKANLQNEGSVEVNHIDGSTTQIIDVVRRPAMVAAPKLSNWKEDMQWEALKPEPLKIKEGGVKNKIQINPEIKTEEVLNEKKGKKHKYPSGASGGDAGAEARKKMRNKEKHKYVNDIRDFDEEITLTRGDYGSRNVKGSAWHTAKSKGFKGYKAGGGLTPQFKLADSYEIDEKKKLAITSPLIDRVSNWSKTKIKESSIQQAATELATKSVENKKKAVGALTKTTEEVVDEGAGEWVQKKLTQVDNAVTKAANTKVGKPIAGALKTIFGPWKPGDGGSNRKSPTAASQKAKGLRVAEHHQKDADGNEIPHDVTEAKVDDKLSPEEKEKARNKRKYGNWPVGQHAQTSIRRSLGWANRGDKKKKGKKVEVDEGKKIKWTVKGSKKDVKDMSKEVGKAKVDYRMLAQSYTPEITVNGTPLDERLGGKGYKRRKDYAGRTVEGDWEDSDRGEGNRAKRRAGGEVKAKSPTYLAHVHNKGKKKVDSKKNPVVNAKEEVEQIDEKNKYAKVTGKNLKHNKVQPKGGTAKGDAAFKSVVARIKKKHGRAALLGGEGQTKKKKGEKGRKQVGDRKGTPADTIAKRRQSKADADAAMRDTTGT